MIRHLGAPLQNILLQIHSTTTTVHPHRRSGIVPIHPHQLRSYVCSTYMLYLDTKINRLTDV